MNETCNDVLYSETVKAGRRIYYFDVKQSHNGDKFVAITESKKIVEGTTESPRFTFEKHKIFLYKEDYEKFTKALQNVISKASGKDTNEGEENQEIPIENTESITENTIENEIKIDVEF